MRRATPRSAAYRLVAALMARDRAFRLRVYPGMVTLAVVLCANMFLFRPRGVSLVQHLRTGPGYVMLLYAAVFIASTVVFEWAKSESASAAWILSALPVPRAGDLLAGALLALALRVVLPCFGLAAALTLYFWGAEHATDVVVAAAVAPLVLAVFVVLGGHRIPFSAPITQESEKRPLAAILAMIVAAIAGGTHYVLGLFYPRTLWVLAAVALVLGCVAITTIVRRPWRPSGAASQVPMKW